MTMAAWERQGLAFSRARQGQYEGCLLGLALGDALGAPVEFLNLDELINCARPPALQPFDCSGKAWLGSICERALQS